jgi:hypothetical protein
MRRCSHGAVSPCNRADNIAKRLDTARRLQNARLQSAAGRVFRYQTLRPNFFSNSVSEIWIMVGRPWGQQ